MMVAWSTGTRNATKNPTLKVTNAMLYVEQKIRASHKIKPAARMLLRGRDILEQIAATERRVLRYGTGTVLGSQL